MRRGCVFQERLLASQTIHFGRKGVIFECTAGLACGCESVQDTFWVDIGDRSLKMSIENMNGGAVLRRTQAIGAYSTLNLSFATDRLPAISGLARDFEATQGSPKALGDYIAGLWENNLQDELVRFVGAPLLRARAKGDESRTEGSAKFWTAENTRVKEYIAPTWSRASVFEAVSYRSWYNNRPLCELLESHIAPQGVDSFGSLSEGCYLKIKGSLAKTRWEINRNGSENVPYMLTSIIGAQLLDHDDKVGIGFLPDYMTTTPDSYQIPFTEKNFVLAVLIQKIYISNFRISGGLISGEKTRKELERIDRIYNKLCLVLRRRELADVGDIQANERVGFTEYANVVHNAVNTDPNRYEDATILLF